MSFFASIYATKFTFKMRLGISSVMSLEYIFSIWPTHESQAISKCHALKKHADSFYISRAQ